MKKLALTQPLVAIIILNYNGRNHLAQFLPSVMATSYNNKRIIVADNASTDESVALVKENFSSAELILLDKNYGYAGGYNKALQRVEADYCVLLNSDVEVTTGWVEPVIELMETDKNIAACQPKILSYMQKDMFEYAGACGGWIDSLGYPFARGRVLDVCEQDAGQYNNVSEIFWASGASMFVRTGVFKQAGGFDENFFSHMEEIDLCFRLKRIGYKIYCCPQSVIFHLGGGTLPKGNYRKVFLNYKNSLTMLHKNITFKERIWKLPLRLFLDISFGLKSLLSGDGKILKAIVNAYASYVQWLLNYTEKIRLPKYPINKLSGVYPKLMAWQYFIKRKRTFSEIVEK